MKTPPDCAFIGTAEGVNLRSLPVSYSPFAPCAVISRHRTAPLHLYTLALWGILILAVHKLLTGTLSRLEGGTESLPLPLPRLAHPHGLGAVPLSIIPRKYMSCVVVGYHERHQLKPSPTATIAASCLPAMPPETGLRARPAAAALRIELRQAAR